MAKVVITEERLNQIIYEAINEAVEEGWLGDKAKQAWSGIKQGAQNLHNGIKNAGGVGQWAAGKAKQGLQTGVNAAKKVVGGVNRAKAWVDQTKSDLLSYGNDEYNIQRDKMRAKRADYDPWQNLSPEERAAISQVSGKDNFGNWKFSAIRYAKALERNGMTDPQKIAETMTQRGFKGITSEYVSQMLSVGRNQTANAQHGNSNPQENPSVTKQAQQGNAQTNTANGNNNRQAVVNKSQEALKNSSSFLTQKGFQLVNGQWVYTKDGSNSPALQSQYPDIVQAARKYNIALKGAKGVYEQRIKKMQKQLMEMQNKLKKARI